MKCSTMKLKFRYWIDDSLNTVVDIQIFSTNPSISDEVTVNILQKEKSKMVFKESAIDLVSGMAGGKQELLSSKKHWVHMF